MAEQELDGVKHFIEKYCYFKEVPIPDWLREQSHLLPFAEAEKIVWLAYKLRVLSFYRIPMPRKEFHKKFLQVCFDLGNTEVSLVPNFKMGGQTLLCFTGVRLAAHYWDIPGYRRANSTVFESKLDGLESYAERFVLRHLAYLPGNDEKLSIIFNAYRYCSDLSCNDFLPDWELFSIASQYIPQISKSGDYPETILHDVKFSLGGIDKEKMMQYIMDTKKSKKLAYNVASNSNS